MTVSVESIGAELALVGSGGRLDLMLELLNRQPTEIFWPVFISWWSLCDGTWPCRRKLVNALRRHSGEDQLGLRYLSDEDRAFFDSLPNVIELFRSCSRSRMRAVSWTTDRKVAEGFVRGHRFIQVPDPVLAVGMVRKADIFLVSTERRESEVLVDPRTVGIRELWDPQSAA